MRKAPMLRRWTVAVMVVGLSHISAMAERPIMELPAFAAFLLSNQDARCAPAQAKLPGQPTRNDPAHSVSRFGSGAAAAASLSSDLNVFVRVKGSRDRIQYGASGNEVSRDPKKIPESGSFSRLLKQGVGANVSSAPKL